MLSSMVHWYWVPLAFWAGMVLGFWVAALLVDAGRSERWSDRLAARTGRDLDQERWRG
jgi:hypothetical protein